MRKTYEMVIITKEGNRVIGGFTKLIDTDNLSIDMNDLYLDMLTRMTVLKQTYCKHESVDRKDICTNCGRDLSRIELSDIENTNHHGHNVDITDEGRDKGWCSDCEVWFDLNSSTIEEYDIANDR